MAERRMFSRSLTESDNFYFMSKNAKLLYFYLNLEADDDGFVSTILKAMFMAGISQDEVEPAIKELVNHNFIIKFDSGIVLITHWRQQNQISPTKRKDTLFQEEMDQIIFDEKTKTYKLYEGGIVPEIGGKNPHSIEQCSIVQDSIGEESTHQNNIIQDSAVQLSGRADFHFF